MEKINVDMIIEVKESEKEECNKMFKDSEEENEKLQIENLLMKPNIDLNEPENDKELMEWAEKHIGENSDTKVELLQELKDMIFERGEFTPDRNDDAFLLRFLRARHFIVRMAHRLMANYYNFKTKTPNFFYNIDYNRILVMGESGIFSVPPYLDQKGRRMLFIQFGIWDTSKFSTDELFQAVILMLQIAIMEPKFQIRGGVCILDVGNLGTSHAWQLTPTRAKQMIEVGYRSLPFRVNAIHIINPSRMFDIAFSIIKPFLTDIMTERILLHQDLESFHKHISPKHLPKRYGGIHEDYSYNKWLNSVKENETLIEELSSIGYKGCKEFLQNINIEM